MLQVRTLSFLKYFYTRNLPALVVKNAYTLGRFFFLIQTFGFIFIYSFMGRLLLINIHFNSLPLITNVVLFTKLSNRLILSSTALKRLTFLAPSLFLLIQSDRRKFVHHLDLLKANRGGEIRGLMA